MILLRFALLAAVSLPLGVTSASQPVATTMPPPPADFPIKPALARETAASFADILERDYVDERIGAAYASALRAGVTRGDYDRAGTAHALARMLTRAVQAVAADGHLKVFVGEGPPSPGRRRILVDLNGVPEGPATPMVPGPGKPIEIAQWLAPGIAFVRFNSFESEPQTIAATAKFMRDHADAKAIIFDLRTHRGGGSLEMSTIFPYLFGREQAVMRRLIRGSVAARSAGVGGPGWRLVEASDRATIEDQFVTPHRKETRLFDARVFVLTSGFTGSAAEHFAAAIKFSKRGILVGERTGGAGHFAFGGPRPINSKFSAFVPVGKTYDPITGRGWEGVGVEPDVKVSAATALVETLTRTGVTRAEAVRISDSVRPTGSMQRINRIAER